MTYDFAAETYRYQIAHYSTPRDSLAPAALEDGPNCTETFSTLLSLSIVNCTMSPTFFVSKYERISSIVLTVLLSMLRITSPPSSISVPLLLERTYPPLSPALSAGPPAIMSTTRKPFACVKFIALAIAEVTLIPETPSEGLCSSSSICCCCCS